MDWRLDESLIGNLDRNPFSFKFIHKAQEHNSEYENCSFVHANLIEDVFF